MAQKDGWERLLPVCMGRIGRPIDRKTQERMIDLHLNSERSHEVDDRDRARAERRGIARPWTILMLFLLALAVGSGLAWLLSIYRWPLLPVLAAALGTLGLAYLVGRMMESAREGDGKGARHLLDTAGFAVMVLNFEGELTYLNRAAGRLLGQAADRKKKWDWDDVLAPGESDRLLERMQRLCCVYRAPEHASVSRIAGYVDCLRILPPGAMPVFLVQLRQQDGGHVSATAHFSALWDAKDRVTGLAIVILGQGAMPQHEQAEQELKQARSEREQVQSELDQVKAEREQLRLDREQARQETEQTQRERELTRSEREKAQRESQERYRDLFEGTSEMLATLSPEGQFLYANPAWQHYFALDRASMLAMPSFEDVFSTSTRSDLAALFRRALEGEPVERAPFRHHTADGRLLDLEMTLSRRQKAGNPLAVRCLLRDVTEQKQRENRLALQLAVSQIVGENAPSEQAGARILETLCDLQGWDLGLEWLVDAGQSQLECVAAWGVAGQHIENFLRRSQSHALKRGDELPERAAREGHPVWCADLSAEQASPRTTDALRHGMVSGWAVPVRAGERVLAVLEFYSRFRLSEAREAIAGVEIAAASLGQLLARTQERGRADDLRRQQEILLDAVSDGICGLDREARVRFANPAASRLLGAKPEALTGRLLHDLLHGSARADRRCGAECFVRKAVAQPVSSAGEENFFRADGSSFPAEYVLTPIHGNGSLTGWVLSFRDITQRYALDRMKDEFISTVSHELRTPLTSIRGALGLLNSGMLGQSSEKASTLLRIALTNSERLIRLINDILDLERIQSGREPLAFRLVQLAEIVRQAIEGLQPMADAAGVKLMHDATRVEVMADPDRLLQVVTNLLANSVKFSPPNSPVNVMVRPGASGVILSVIDRGRGIPADKLETIFGRFQQVDASDSRQKGGTGLGLAICRTIVLQHSGRIWAERNRGRGSTFRIFLPYRPDPTAEQGMTPLMESAQGTVVLAGANAESRLRIAGVLARHGFSVVQTGTVEQTLIAARRGAHAILLDTALDGLNGWSILPLLRRTESTAKIPVALLGVEDTKNPPSPPENAEAVVSEPAEGTALLAEMAHVLAGPEEAMRILIVDDDRDLARIIGEMIARAGISVAITHSLDGTVEACSAFQPHLIVLDIALADGDGFNVVDWLRQQEALARMPLVIYSGRELSAIERRYLSLGPTHFLAHARVQPQQLEALVLTMLRMARPAGQPAEESSAVANPEVI